MSKPGSFVWYELLTTDADGAAEFYGEVVGWAIADHPDPKADLDYRMIVRTDGGHNGGVLQLTADMCAQGAHPLWVGYQHVEDVDAAVAAIVADGGRVLMPRKDIAEGAFAMLTDPTGTPFYVMKPNPPPGKPAAKSDVFSVTTAGHVRWNELSSNDQAVAKAFYAKHFHFEYNRSMSMGAMGSYDFIDHDGVCLGAILQKPPQNPHAGWLFYFGVTSVTTAKAAIEANGGKVLMGPQEVPGGESIVIALDPQGAAFGVVGPL